MSVASVTLRRAVIATLAASVAVTLSVSAQETENSGSRNIETIVVTAQKREQNLQDVPIVVTSVSGQLLQDNGVRDIKDLTILAPGLTVTSSSSEASTTARIRGIGTVGDNPGLESSVGIVIDGVYRPRNGVGFGDLGELERIEVLKGPQGTLFGKNTSAGVINIVTKKPSYDFGADVELTAGNYGQMEGAASITGGFNDKLAGRLYVASRERDGFLDVVTGQGPRTTDEDYDRNFYTVRGQLLIDPVDTLSIRLIGDYTKREEHCCAAPQYVLGTSVPIVNLTRPGSIPTTADAYGRVAYSNRLTDQDIEEVGASAEINWEINDSMSLTSITAWRDWDFTMAQDADFTLADILYRDPAGPNGTEFEQLSQELRLQGDTDRINWLVGAFYAHEEVTTKAQLVRGTDWERYVSFLSTAGATPNLFASFGANFAGNFGYDDLYEQKSDTFALFTNNTIKITDRFEATIGVRYTDESKDLDAHYTNDRNENVGCGALRANAAAIAGALPPAAQAAVFGLGCVAYNDPNYNNLVLPTQTLDEEEWSGTLKFSYRFTDDVMAYISGARGYKAGGFNFDRERIGGPVVAVPDTDLSFDKELVDSYEVGAKTEWLNNTLLLNATVFYQEYQDFQLNTFTGLQFEVRSVPEVVSQGVDLDMVWFTPFEPLSIQGGVTYAETEITDFTGTVGFDPNRENDRMSFAPEWSASLALTYEQPIGAAFLFRGNIGAKYTSEYNTGSNLDPRKIQDDLTLINARIGFGAEDEKWMIEAWAVNLTDEDYLQVVFDATHQGSAATPAAPTATSTLNAFLGAPRTYGVTARFKF